MMKLFTKFAAAIFLTAIVQYACADGPLVIRFSHVVSPDSPKGQAAQRFADLVATRTAGKVRVDVLPNGKLYGDQDEIAALLMGSVEILAPSLTKLKVLHAPEFEVFDLPYLFQDIDAAHRVTQGQIGKDLLAKLEPQGVIGLAIWDNGFKQMSANRPVHLPADLTGLSMRVQPSRILEVQMKDMGAKPRVLPFGEVYSALRTGAVDGTEGPASNFHTQNLQLSQKYLTVSNHGYLGYGVVVNKKFWNALAPDIRIALEGSMREATTFANVTAQTNNDDALAAIEKSGKTKVIRLSDDEKMVWQKTLGQVHQQTGGRIPAELIERIYQQAGYHQTAVSMR
jgi:C4-dicarboxylate-binding protein DctP